MLKHLKNIILIFFISLGSLSVNAQKIVVTPSSPYLEDFNASNGGWFVASGSNNSDWVWGKPNKTTINAVASGINCWMTGGYTSSIYGSNENSYLQSPNFDLSALTTPYIKFKIFWEDEYTFDGSNLQYSVDGINWKIVGNVEPASCLVSNWYNGNVRYIGSVPGWSGSVNKGTDGNCPSGGGLGTWVTAQHDLPYSVYADLKNATNVRFRFNFGAGSQCNGYDGFAIDDFFIGEAPDVAITINSHPANTSGCNNSGTSFTVSAKNAVSYEWQVSNNNGSFFTIISNGGVYSGANTAALNISNVTGLNNNQYRVKVIGATSSCSLLSSVAKLTVNDQAVITSQPVDKNVCATTPVTFNVDATGTNILFQWQQSSDNGTTWNNIVNGGVYSNANSKTLNISNSNGLSGHKFRALVNASGCPGVASNAALLTATTTAMPSVVTPVVYCRNDKAQTLSASGNQLLWYNVAEGGSGDISAPVPSTLNSGTFNYYVTQTQNGCESDRNIITVTVRSVNVFLTATPNPVLSGDVVTLATSASQPYAVLAWEPSNQFADQHALQQSIVVEKSNIYAVVAQSQGCVDTVKVNVIVKLPTQDIFIPNAFTPNHDNKNDLLLIYGNNILSSEMHIYNQWGQQIFVSKDRNTGWDGTFKGKEQPTGIYIYVVKVIFTDGMPLTKKGSFTLIR